MNVNCDNPTFAHNQVYDPQKDEKIISHLVVFLHKETKILSPCRNIHNNIPHHCGRDLVICLNSFFSTSLIACLSMTHDDTTDDSAESCACSSFKSPIS